MDNGTKILVISAYFSLRLVIFQDLVFALAGAETIGPDASQIQVTGFSVQGSWTGAFSVPLRQTYQDRPNPFILFVTYTLAQSHLIPLALFRFVHVCTAFSSSSL